MPLRVAAAAPVGPIPAQTPAPAPPPPRSVAPAQDRDLLAHWDETLRGPNPIPANLAGAWNTAAKQAAGLWETAHGLARDPAGADVAEVNPRASLIIAEESGADRLADTTVLVTAPNP